MCEPQSKLDDLMAPLTPNQLLIGRSSSEPVRMEFDENDGFVARQAYIQQLHQAWWTRWIQEVLPTLVPCKRWRDIRRNLKVNDLVMMKYPGQLKDDYRIAKVIKVYPDQKGLIRTVRVAYRKRDKREPTEVYWKKRLTEEDVAIQRLSILQAAGEGFPKGGIADEYPIDVDQRLATVKSCFVKIETLEHMNLFK